MMPLYPGGAQSGALISERGRKQHATALAA